MMKKLVALLMALALLCSSIAALADEPDTPAVGSHVHTADTSKEISRTTVTYCTDDLVITYECKICGAPVDVLVKHGTDHQPGKGDQTYFKDGVLPTCTQSAIMVHSKCLNCEIGTWEEDYGYGEHNFDPERCEETKPTCYAAGYWTKYCLSCKKDIVTPGDPQLKHKYVTQKDVTKLPTCVEDGIEGSAQICEYCKDIKEFSEDDRRTIGALKHEDYFKNTLLPEYFTITRDSKTQEIETAAIVKKHAKEFENGVAKIPATDIPGVGHYGASTITYKAADCTNNGLIAFKCEDCGKEYNVVIPAPGHTWNVTYSADQTADNVLDKKLLDCVKGYYVLYTCSVCNAHEIEHVCKTNHDFTKYEQDDTLVVKYLQQKLGDTEPMEYAWRDIAPCREYWVVVKCGNDHCAVTTTIHKDATTDEHTKGALIRTTPSTCTVLGETVYNCQYCLYPQTIPETEYAPHDWDEKVTKLATCDEPGVRVKTCKVCKKEETEAIPVLGHNYVETPIKVADCTKEIVGTMGMVCTRCNDVKSSWEYEGHERGTNKYLTNTAATCEVGGLRTYVCSKCCVVVEEKTAPTGHSFEYDGKKYVGAEAYKLLHETKCSEETSLMTGCEAGDCSSTNHHGTIHTVKCAWCPKGKEAVLTWTMDNAPEHKYEVTSKGVLKNFNVDVAPTCCTEGKASFTCVLCKEAVHDYPLPAFGHNKQAKYDEKKGIYELYCAKLEAKAAGQKKLSEMLKTAGYTKEVADAVTSAMLQSTYNNYFRGIGACGWTDDIVVRAPEYSITVDGSNATIALKDKDNMNDLDTPYLRVNWRYRLTNGDTVAFNYTFAPDKDGSYFIDAPDCDGKLEMTYIEVVTSRTAHRMDLGEYPTYGSKKL